jgi:hypothetical protein
MVNSFNMETISLNSYDNLIMVIGMEKRKKVKQWKIWGTGDKTKIILEATEELSRIVKLDQISWC